jgi:hypothetical protein
MNMPASKGPRVTKQQPAVMFVSACKDEEDKYPREALRGGSLEALAAFCEVRYLVRRAECFRDLLRRGKDLPERFYSWRFIPPDIEHARKRVEDCRPALTVGFRRGLQSKEHRIIEWTLEHERAIDQVTPLVKALAKFKESRWRKMDLVQRINFASEALAGVDDHWEQDLGLAYVEAKGAANLLKLPKDDRRIVIDGAYACYRLDWLTRVGDSKQSRAELQAHVKTIISVANDLKEYTLAEKIDAATATVQKIIVFTKSALFDQFKGHLIEATKLRLQIQPTAMPAPVNPPSTSTNPGTTYSVATVLEMAGVSDTTLNQYAKRARVKTPGRGKRNHRYTADEVRLILQTIINSTTDRRMKERCRGALAKL